MVCALLLVQANEIHMFLQTSYVSVDEMSAATADTAGVRVLNMGATCIHAQLGVGLQKPSGRGLPP